MCNPLEKCWVNQIVHGDCIDLMQMMPTESVPLVVTSPPYGSIRAFGGHSFDGEAVIEGISRIVQPGGIVVWVEQDQIKDRLCSFSSFTNCHKFRQLGFELVVPLVTVMALAQRSLGGGSG